MADRRARVWTKVALNRLGLLPTAQRTREFVRYRHDTALARRAAAGFPIPPASLTATVSGTSDPIWYAKSGWLAAESIRFGLGRNGINVDDLGAMLDFGCGCGRVIRYWGRHSGPVHGTDYNPELIRWCERYLPFAQFRVNELDPPLHYPDSSFDLIYALSVFTHLDEARQLAWMAELRRIAKPGGYVIITSHGDCPVYTRRLSLPELAQFRQGKLIVHVGGPLGSNQVAAYHPVEYVRGPLTEGLTVLDHLAGGAFGNPYQDLYLLRRPESQATVLS
jgi:SAM-dependent methyltransferase